MERTAKGYRLTSGREVYANRGMIAISRAADGTFTVGEGYDGMILGATGEEYVEDGDEPTNWTREERLELAEHMVNMWRAYGEFPY